ncbi:uncharacterized protein LOC118648594 [Monomorium pharaonis]|uniref:uncharacterized protein LOC118648594 n=1 Tax=Monomorium pharaonis TaxID=307658 RepID=UPI001747CF2B|nr:uncharacterized protein LOC118648594 [Monomorium pharaonis]
MELPLPHQCSTLLATCRAVIRPVSQVPYPVRLLIDQGSQLTFVSEVLVQNLRIPRRASAIPLVGIGGTAAGYTRGVVTIRLHSIHDSQKSCSIQAFVLPHLTAKLPLYNVVRRNWSHINGLQLADPEFFRPGHVDVIIGSDNYGHIICDGLHKGGPKEPVAQKTLFGWILFGPVTSEKSLQDPLAYHCSVDDSLQEILTRFWKQEEIVPLTSSLLSPDEAECEKHFVATHRRDSTGRYVVRLPFKSSPHTLGDSRKSALACLSRLTKRFSFDAKYKQLYEEFIQEYLSLGHMKEAPTEEEFPRFHLPHHGIVKQQNESSKIRVVFNGSSRSSTNVSLNDILHSGAKLQVDLAKVLLWARSHRFIFVADIVKMFRQISVHPEDWRYQSILWQRPDQEVIVYYLTTVTYGLSCAPFLALRCLQQLIEDEGPKFPKAIPPLSKGRYVDDIFGGADSIIEAKEIIQQVKNLCNAGGFPLLKWQSNNPELLPTATSTNPRNEINLEFERSLIKILGIEWKPSTDTFHFSIQPSNSNKYTKRAILSEIARLFDPLGLLSPVIIRAKILLQEMWLLKIEWDESLPESVQQRWSDFRQELLLLSQISIPRWLGFLTTSTLVELHGFADASNLAMAAVVYVKTETLDKEFSVRLACAKSRVAPLKRVTIPRLELCAALLLARLMKQTIETLNLKETPIFLWTDSSATLAWTTAHPSRWKDYVRNRVTTIQELLPSASWRYVPGKENPADCASRGLCTERFIEHELWWNGPRWLSSLSTEWPSLKAQLPPDIDLENRSDCALSAVTHPTPYWNLLDRYSSLKCLLRITALCQRFIARLRKQTNLSSEPLSPEDLLHSRLLWCKIVQQSWFSQEIRILFQGGNLPRSNHLIRLTPFIDKDGILRVGGRLHFAKIDNETKHPVILPRHSPFTTLVIADAHRRTLHGGTQVTLSFLRQTYWILGGRAPVRSFILKCVRCSRYRGQRAQQLMGQLPSSRVVPSRPFLHAGLDYAGPMQLKTWRGRATRSYKGYLAIFICLATSAIHIEIVTDYTTEAFLAAYKRFSGRRGVCATLRSDCGTNFVGADSILRQRFATSSKELRDLAILLANDGTEWLFNPPSAPHFGGKWEAAVKSTKYHLARLLGDTTLTYEELSTIVIQIEAVLNSRPLCPLSDDPEDLSALTPGHFLIGEAPTVIPEPSLAEETLSRLSRWQLVRQKVDLFWKRWSAECLQRFQAISKWHHPSNCIVEGSLVLVTDERYPPAKWPLGRVIELHKGPDGLARVVTLRTASGSYKRPITKLCVLPIDPDAGYPTTASPDAGGNVTEKS